MQRKIATLTYQESNALLAALCDIGSTANHTPRKVRNYTIALLMLDVGLRVGEVCGLQIRDLIYNGEPVLALTVRAEISKSKAERTLPLSARLQDAIRLMITALPNAGVLPGQRPIFFRGTWGQTGTERAEETYAPITTRQVQRIIGQAAHTAFGRSIHPHSLRHTFGTRLAKVLPIKGVQDALGHRQLSSTQVYIHPDSEDLKNGIAAITEGNPQT
ncbi:site-specific integrase [Candidatus Pacearchaeota archaeon]|nr:site-specific integrase [Candidatus Pacearchaeota archaeon]